MKKIVNGQLQDMTAAEVVAYQEDEAARVAQEALTRYQHARAEAYPLMADFLDAMVKINSDDAQLIAEGEAQARAYYDACLAVKLAHPKPEGGV